MHLSQGNITLLIIVGGLVLVAIAEEIGRAIVMRGRDRRRAVVAAVDRARGTSVDDEYIAEVERLGGSPELIAALRARGRK